MCSRSRLPRASSLASRAGRLQVAIGESPEFVVAIGVNFLEPALQT